MQKGTVLIWLVVAILLAVITSGIYLLITQRTNILNSSVSQSQSSVQPTATSVINNPPTEADLKTYSNVEEGYKFQHPREWNVESYKEKYPQAYQPEYNKGQVIFESRKIGPEDGQGLPVDLGSGSIKFITTQFLGGTTYAKITEKDFFNLEDKETWRRGEVGGGGLGYAYSVPEEITIGGKRAVKQQYHPTTSYEAASPDNITVNYYIWLGDNKIMHIEFTYNDKNSNKEALLKSFNTIISTLEFTQ